MKTVVVLSGKGGTGKTSVTASLAMFEARSGASLVIADADVDASNLPLLLQPGVIESHPFIGGEIAVVDAAACSAHGACVTNCRFDAIHLADAHGPARIDAAACEGCAVCTLVCPEEAISMVPRRAGTWSTGESRFGPMAYAELGPGGENSGKLVTQVRQAATSLARERGAGLVLVDGPPGTGCAVIAAMTGADLVVAVTEPTPSARSDLERLLKLARSFRCPAGVVFNKADLNTGFVEATAEELSAKDVALLGSIPYSQDVPACIGRGLCPAECGGPVAEALEKVHGRIRALVRRQAGSAPATLPVNEQDPEINSGG